MEPSRVSRRVRRRWLAAALGTLIGLSVGWAVWRVVASRRDPPGLDRVAVADLLDRRSREAHAPLDEADVDARRPEDWRWYVPPEACIFEVQTRINQPDPWCYYAHKPNLRHEVEWPEHPRGTWTFQTNSLGLRDDDEPRAGRPDLRVLVTGDSHTDGFCDNRDSWANRLEARLAERYPGAAVEVLNAGDIAYSFYNYLGVLERHRALAPHVYVVLIHAGNDFREALLPYRYFARLPLPPRDLGEEPPEGRAGEIFVPASQQGLQSVARFQSAPDEREAARSAALEVFGELRRICAERGIALVCAYLPSPVEAESERFQDLIEPTREALGLSAADVADHAAYTRDVLRDIAALGILVHDTSDALRAAGNACFWRTDLHLNLLGHEVVARELEPLVARHSGLER